MDDSQHPVRHIHLLGAQRVGDTPLAGEKTAALLACLALQTRTLHRREALIDLIWPELPPDSARRALSDALYRLRKLLGEGCLITATGRVGVDPARVWTDVAAFSLLAAADDAASLEEALALYAGPLAPEVYMDWIQPYRAALHEQHLDALERLGRLAESAARPEQALDYFRQAAADPLRESAQRGIMRALARLGRRPAALEAYARLERLLDDELAVRPEPETVALAEQIRAEADLRHELADRPARPAFVGRVAERAAALLRVEVALAGRGGALAVEGPPGIGKSRLWQEIAAGASWRGATVLTAQAHEYPTDSPLDPLASLLRQGLNGPRAAQVELLLPDETLAAIAELYPPWRDRAALAELPPPQARLRWEKGVRAVFRTLADLAPHVLILDDLQWAGPALWDALELLLSVAAEGRLLIGLSYRRPAIEDSVGWARLQAWQRAGDLTTITLGPLAANEVADMLPAAHQTSAALVAAVSGGNPFTITQAVFALQHDLPLATAEQILADRLAAVPAPARAVLEAAAVLGTDIPLRLWAGLVAAEPAEFISVAELLADEQLVLPATGGYAFAHDMLHAAVYGGIDPDTRQALHDRAARALMEAGDANDHALAFHLERAGRAAEAAVAYRAAGRQDMAAFAYAEAGAAFERALELWSPAPEAERIATLFDLAQIGDNTGDRARQRRALDDALRGAQQLESDDLVLRALVGLGRLAAVTGDMDNATRNLDAARQLAAQVTDAVWQFEAVFYAGDLEARRGRLAAARDAFGQALQLARESASPLNEARALRGLSIVSRLSGDLGAAMTLTEQALDLQRAHGDVFGASVTMTNQLATLYDMGAWDRLVELADEALAVKEQLGDRHGVAIVHHMQGLAAYALGDLERARRSLSAARAGFEAVQDRRTAALARNVLGLIAEASGDLAAAEADLAAAVAEADAVGAATEAAYARHDLGALLLALGRAEDAVGLLTQAAATWRASGNDFLRHKSEAVLGLALAHRDPGRAAQLAGEGWAALQAGIPAGEMPQTWLWGLFELLTAVQRPAEAEAVIRIAYAELQRQAAAILDPVERRHFFERVPLNRHIVAAYDDVAGSARQRVVLLARLDAPVGAPLSPDDRVAVTWTVAAPQDDLIADAAQRRRHVLLRLIDEARAQGAAPTDDDLAGALGVSRRTILRDMQALAQMGQSRATRGRK